MSSAFNDWQALWLTLQLAGVSTLCLLTLGIPLAWWLARTESRWRHPVQAVIALPLVLPPTVIGFYLLICLGPSGPVGTITQALGIGTLAFTFTGLVIGSVIYSLPFVVQPLENAFSAIDETLLEQASILGASPPNRFFSLAMPLARPGLITAIVLGFAHTLGEFGVVLMIGGNIPGETRVASIAIYDHVESLQYAQAHLLSGGMLLLGFLLLLGLYVFIKPRWLR